MGADRICQYCGVRPVSQRVPSAAVHGGGARWMCEACASDYREAFERPLEAVREREALRS